MLIGIMHCFAQEDQGTVAMLANKALTTGISPDYLMAGNNAYFNITESEVEDQSPIDINFIQQSQTICSNATPATLLGSAPTGGDGPGTYNYQWQKSIASATAGFSDISLANAVNYSPPSLTATTWYRRVVVSGVESDTSDAVQITVKPPINLVITDPAPVCSPQIVDITAPAVTAGSSAGLTFTYHTKADGTTVLNNPSSISSALKLEKTYYIKANNGCEIVIKPVNVLINKPPTLSILSQPPPVPVCKYTQIGLSAISMDGVVTWKNLSTLSYAIVYPTEQTTYTAVATNPTTGCVKTTDVTATVIDFSMTLSSSPDPLIAGNPVTLTPGSADNFTVTGWLPQTTFANQAAGIQTFTINDTSRTFSVIGQSEAGCLDTASVKVKIDVNTTDVFVPNAFTPNNDGRNDIFKVYGSSIRYVEMKIFDQWGKSIHETNNNSTGWDGSHKGKPQPAGIYMYVIKIKLENEDSFIRKGTLNLIR